MVVLWLGQVIRILHVDDNPDSREQVRWWLLHSTNEVEVMSTGSAAQALRELKKNDYSCVLSDYDMPEMDGLELLSTLRSEDNHIPFVMLTNYCDDELIEAACRAGADGYCEKESALSQRFVLLNSIEQAIKSRDRLRSKSRAHGNSNNPQVDSQGKANNRPTEPR